MASSGSDYYGASGYLMLFGLSDQGAGCRGVQAKQRLLAMGTMIKEEEGDADGGQSAERLHPPAPCTPQEQLADLRRRRKTEIQAVRAELPHWVRRSQGPDAAALRRAVDLPDLCEKLLGVRLEQAGESNWTGTCPLHDDRSPSFSVYRGDDGAFRCGCFAGCVPFPDDRDFGDCFDLVRAWAALQGQDDPGFRWAVEEVARLTGGVGPAEHHLDETLARIERSSLADEAKEAARARARRWYRLGLLGPPIGAAAGEDDDGPVVVPPRGWDAEEE